MAKTLSERKYPARVKDIAGFWKKIYVVAFIPHGTNKEYFVADNPSGRTSDIENAIAYHYEKEAQHAAYDYPEGEVLEAYL